MGDVQTNENETGLPIPLWKQHLLGSALDRETHGMRATLQQVIQPRDVLAEGGDIPGVDLGGDNSLLQAEILNIHGVPATIVDNRGCDALSLALFRGAFGLARCLPANGESLNRPSGIGVTVLGSLFFPDHARQVDDLPATLRFILSLEPKDSNEFFIVSDYVKTSVIHIAAVKYNPDPISRQMLEILLCHYSKPEHLNAKVTTPARSTALRSATEVLNPVAAELLLSAGADHTQLDVEERTCLDIAFQRLAKLTMFNCENESVRDDEFERAGKIVHLLAQKNG
ncbi:hypothetical protein OQA88_2850 [Cercophora sp. LCS_1]